MPLTLLAGLVIAGLAIAFAEATGKPSSAVLFSGQTALTPLLEHAASYTVGTLVLLVVCKGLAYSLSLSSFRGGPTYPACSSAQRAGSPCRTCPACR